MALGGVVLAFNIITRLAMSFSKCIESSTKSSRSSSYINVYKARTAAKESPFTPLLYLLPFPVTVAIQVAWLSSPSFSRSYIINSPLFMPFLCTWGLQFAHQVGRMILAHVSKQPFPWWDWMWVWSIVGALDANMPRLFNRYFSILLRYFAFVSNAFTGSHLSNTPPIVSHISFTRLSQSRSFIMRDS